MSLDLPVHKGSSVDSRQSRWLLTRPGALRRVCRERQNLLPRHKQEKYIKLPLHLAPGTAENNATTDARVLIAGSKLRAFALAQWHCNVRKVRRAMPLLNSNFRAYTVTERLYAQLNLQRHQHHWTSTSLGYCQETSIANYTSLQIPVLYSCIYSTAASCGSSATVGRNS